MSGIRKFYDVPGGRLSAVHFGDISKPIKLVFLHATGFNALAYRSLLGPLGRESGVHSVAIDMRGHGMTDLPAIPDDLVNWTLLRDDILAFLKAYVSSPVIMAGHSCGAGVSLMVGAKAGDAVKAVVAFDPVTIPFTARKFMAFKWGRDIAKKRFSLARNAGKRRAVFDSKQAVFERYQGRGTFKNMPDAALRDYIDGGFVETASGVELACTPAWEQAIFVAQNQNIFKAAKLGPKLTRVVYAKKDSPSDAPMRARMGRVLGADRVETHMDRAHFYPLEDPGFAREFLLKAVGF